MDSEESSGSQKTLYLSCTWTFFYDRGIEKAGDWKNNVSEIGSFDSVNLFWSFWNAIPFDKFPLYFNLRIFKDAIDPTFEHPRNTNGGRYVIRFEKQYRYAVWERLILFTIGSQCSDDPVNGVVLSGRKGHDQVQFWCGVPSEKISKSMLNILEEVTGSKLEVFFQLHSHAKKSPIPVRKRRKSSRKWIKKRFSSGRPGNYNRGRGRSRNGNSNNNNDSDSPPVSPNSQKNRRRKGSNNINDQVDDNIYFRYEKKNKGKSRKSSRVVLVDVSEPPSSNTMKEFGKIRIMKRTPDNIEKKEEEEEKKTTLTCESVERSLNIQFEMEARKNVSKNRDREESEEDCGENNQEKEEKKKAEEEEIDVSSDTIILQSSIYSGQEKEKEQQQQQQEEKKQQKTEEEKNIPPPTKITKKKRNNSNSNIIIVKKINKKKTKKKKGKSTNNYGVLMKKKGSSSSSSLSKFIYTFLFIFVLVIGISSVSFTLYGDNLFTSWLRRRRSSVK